VIYPDTSALVKLYVLEAGSEFVQSCLSEQDDPLPVWELQEAELANALHLKVFRNE
jgi:predicted nucleic acid-binding protein